jgi:hypothetical protein
MDDYVYALAVDGSGNLYAGGDFTVAGGAPANHVAAWDGSSWSALGSGVDSTVYDLAVDGNGKLWVAGAFSAAGGVPVDNVAVWDGGSWSPLGAGTSNAAYALAVAASGRDLYVGGDFSLAGGTPSSYLARWHDEPPLPEDDGYDLLVDTVLTVPAPGVLANDTDPEDDALSVSLVTPPSHGSAVLEPDGSLTYTPAVGHTGPDALVYAAVDVHGAAANATVNLNVIDVLFYDGFESGDTSKWDRALP